MKVGLDFEPMDILVKDGDQLAMSRWRFAANGDWKLALGRRVGEPILADLDGDNRAEILVAAEDGRLYCLQGEPDSTRH